MITALDLLFLAGAVYLVSAAFFNLYLNKRRKAKR